MSGNITNQLEWNAKEQLHALAEEINDNEGWQDAKSFSKQEMTGWLAPKQFNEWKKASSQNNCIEKSICEQSEESESPSIIQVTYNRSSTPNWRSRQERKRLQTKKKEDNYNPLNNLIVSSKKETQIVTPPAVFEFKSNSTEQQQQCSDNSKNILPNLCDSEDTQSTTTTINNTQQQSTQQNQQLLGKNHGVQFKMQSVYSRALYTAAANKTRNIFSLQNSYKDNEALNQAYENERNMQINEEQKLKQLWNNISELNQNNRFTKSSVPKSQGLHQKLMFSSSLLLPNEDYQSTNSVSKNSQNASNYLENGNNSLELNGKKGEHNQSPNTKTYSEKASISVMNSTSNQFSNVITNFLKTKIQQKKVKQQNLLRVSKINNTKVYCRRNNSINLRKTESELREIDVNSNKKNQKDRQKSVGTSPIDSDFANNDSAIQQQKGGDVWLKLYYDRFENQSDHFLSEPKKLKDDKNNHKIIWSKKDSSINKDLMAENSQSELEFAYNVSAVNPIGQSLNNGNCYASSIQQLTTQYSQQSTLQSPLNSLYQTQNIKQGNQDKQHQQQHQHQHQQQQQQEKQKQIDNLQQTMAISQTLPFQQTQLQQYQLSKLQMQKQENYQKFIQLTQSTFPKYVEEKDQQSVQEIQTILIKTPPPPPNPVNLRTHVVAKRFHSLLKQNPQNLNQTQQSFNLGQINSLKQSTYSINDYPNQIKITQQQQAQQQQQSSKQNENLNLNMHQQLHLLDQQIFCPKIPLVSSSQQQQSYQQQQLFDSQSIKYILSQSPKVHQKLFQINQVKYNQQYKKENVLQSYPKKIEGYGGISSSPKSCSLPTNPYSIPSSFSPLKQSFSPKGNISLLQPLKQPSNNNTNNNSLMQKLIENNNGNTNNILLVNQQAQQNLRQKIILNPSHKQSNSLIKEQEFIPSPQIEDKNSFPRFQSATPTQRKQTSFHRVKGVEIKSGLTNESLCLQNNFIYQEIMKKMNLYS